MQPQQKQKEKVDKNGNPIKVGSQYVYKNSRVVVRKLDSNVPNKVTAERLSNNGKPLGTTFDAIPEELELYSLPKTKSKSEKQPAQ